MAKTKKAPAKAQGKSDAEKYRLRQAQQLIDELNEMDEICWEQALLEELGAVVERTRKVLRAKMPDKDRNAKIKVELQQLGNLVQRHGKRRVIKAFQRYEVQK